MIKQNFHILLKSFGPQGWWPTTPPSGSKPIYHHKKPINKRTEQEKFEICLGAILTQNTSWENVVKVLKTLKAHHVLTLKGILSLSKIKCEHFLKSSGYFRQKADRVRNFFSLIQKKAKGRVDIFLKGRLTKIREKLLLIKGIGPETADSMLLYAGGHPVFVVDAYTRRIGIRWGVLNGDENYHEIQRIFSKSLPKSMKNYGEYHALLVKLAKQFCKKKPICQNCPVKKICKVGKLI